jgi:hypothetical protein
MPAPPADPSPQRGRLPIPFIIELLAVIGACIPFFALFQGCDCALRPWLVFCGVVLCLPLFLFELLWRLRCSRSWLLWRLAAGSYAVNVQSRELGFLWTPTTAELKQEECGQVSSKAFLSFGEWYYNPQFQVGATIRRVLRSPDVPQASSHLRSIAFNCSLLTWTNAAAMLDGSGDITGLPKPAKFDGNILTLNADSGKEIQWAKFGCMRLEWLRKVMCVSAVVGFAMAVVAASFHPGLTSDCGPKVTERSRVVRMPLRAIFLVDGSSSVKADFEAEKNATEAIMKGFRQAFRSDAQQLYQGVVQFSDDMQLESKLSNDFAEVNVAVRSMQLLTGGTSFEGPLRKCQNLFDQHTDAGQQTFDVCILITDGKTVESSSQLQATLKSNTKLMGIYVGTNATHRDKLHSLTSCASPAGKQCPFFVSASDFALLRSRAGELSQGVTTGLLNQVTEEVVRHECHAPLWTFAGLLLWVPFLSWWCYLHVNCLKRKSPTTHRATKDPQRLRTAGANEERKI